MNTPPGPDRRSTALWTLIRRDGGVRLHVERAGVERAAARLGCHGDEFELVGIQVCRSVRPLDLRWLEHSLLRVVPGVAVDRALACVLMPPVVGDRSPWGAVLRVRTLGHGAWHVSTADEGGFFINVDAQCRLPADVRRCHGWYGRGRDGVILAHFLGWAHGTALAEQVRAQAQQSRPDLFDP